MLKKIFLFLAAQLRPRFRPIHFSITPFNRDPGDRSVPLPPPLPRQDCGDGRRTALGARDGVRFYCVVRPSRPSSDVCIPRPATPHERAGTGPRPPMSLPAPPPPRYLRRPAPLFGGAPALRRRSRVFYMQRAVRWLPGGACRRRLPSADANGDGCVSAAWILTGP